MKFLYPNALITADDWGMSPGVNEGILKLAKEGVVRRVSCMANGRFLTHGLEELKQVKNLEAGLHFDLTFGKTFSQKLRLVWNAFFLPQKLRAFVTEEFRSQWKSLVSLGLNPSYVDGHHHVHLLPGVLKALIFEGRFAGVKNVRTVTDPRLLFSLKLPVVLLSHWGKPLLQKAGLGTLPCWYPKIERIGEARFRNHLRALTLKTEVIVHPAQVDDFALHGIEDPYTDGRLGEFKVLEGLAST